MSTDVHLKEMLTLHEGRKKFPYHCTARKISIGIGHNLTDRGIDSDIIDILFTRDLALAISDASDLFPNLYEIDSVRRDALIDMSFNFGKTSLGKFKQLRLAVAERNWPRSCWAARTSVWYVNPVGHPRKYRVTEMLKTGKDPGYQSWRRLKKLIRKKVV